MRFPGPATVLYHGGSLRRGDGRLRVARLRRPEAAPAPTSPRPSSLPIAAHFWHDGVMALWVFFRVSGTGAGLGQVGDGDGRDGFLTARWSCGSFPSLGDRESDAPPLSDASHPSPRAAPCTGPSRPPPPPPLNPEQKRGSDA
jgi:hypothetical protein